MRYLDIEISKVFLAICCLLIEMRVMAGDKDPGDKGKFKSTGMSFSISGTMGSTLPGVNDIFKNDFILNLRPGEGLFTSKRWCGDGDVASYYAAHPKETNANGQVSEKVVLGYWVSDVSTRAVPDEKSWFMFGYGELPIDDGNLSTLSKPNESSPVPIGSLVRTEADLILKQLDTARPTLPGKPHYVYFAAMLCNNLEDSSGASVPSGSFSPRASSLASGLITYLNDIAENDVDSNLDDLAQNKKKVSVSFLKNDRTPVKVNFVGGSVSQSNFGSALDSLNSLAYPSVKAPAVLKMGDYRSAIGSVKSKLTQLKAFCSGEIIKTDNEFWWESVPLHLTCKNIVGANYSAKIDSLNGGSADDTSPPVSQSDFKDIKASLMRIVGSSEILTQVQADIKNQGLTQNKARCFPIGGRPYIETVIASLPFTVEAPVIAGSKITYSIGGPKSEMTHPEGNYISIAASVYYPNAGAVFMAPGNPMEVTTPLPPNRIFDFSKTLFQFHVRDVGCSNGPTYCHRMDNLGYPLRAM